MAKNQNSNEHKTNTVEAPDFKRHSVTAVSRRKNLIMVGSVIIFILAAISFIFLPAMADFSVRELPPLGKYKGKKIEDKPGSYFNKMYSIVRNQERNNSVTDEFEILQQTFDNTIFFMTFSDVLKTTDFALSDSAINREMVTYFSDEDGVYSPKAYRDTPSSAINELRQSISESLFYQQVLNDYFGKGDIGSFSAVSPSYFQGIRRSDKESLYTVELGNDLRKIQYVSIPFSSYPQEEAVKFGKENADLFKKYNFSVISAYDEGKIKSHRQQILSGEVTFEDGVKEFSDKLFSGDDGVLKDNYAYQLKNLIDDEEVFKKLTSLPVGEVSDVIKTVSGYSIFKVTAAATEPDFEELALKDTLVSYMNENEAGRIEDYLLGRGTDFANEVHKNGFAAAAEKFDLEVKATDSSFALNYNSNGFLRTIYGDGLDGADKNEEFLKTAFTLKENEISKPFLLDKNVVVFQPTEFTMLEEADKNLDNFMLQYYPSSFDQNALNEFVLKSDAVENNLLPVYLEYYVPQPEA
ncbi:MAG: peptidylprolyl isomerase [Spirochaetaceae bacterium]|nr:peptidylprolyl isomerase [Spirochaetaceae bacterium]